MNIFIRVLFLGKDIDIMSKKTTKSSQENNQKTFRLLINRFYFANGRYETRPDYFYFTVNKTFEDGSDYYSTNFYYFNSAKMSKPLLLFYEITIVQMGLARDERVSAFSKFEIIPKEIIREFFYDVYGIMTDSDYYKLGFEEDMGTVDKFARSKYFYRLVKQVQEQTSEKILEEHKK